MTPDAMLAAARAGQSPDPALPGPLRALCAEAAGDWAAAHEIVQPDASREAAWVHAYLHRKEPDPGNAAYWYRRAGRPVSAAAFDAEWLEIAAGIQSP